MGFFTADLCDEFFDSVRVLEPIFRSYGGLLKCEGEIATVKLDEDNSELISLLKEEGRGRVVVVDANGDYCAIVGDKLMGIAKKNGWSGIVVNGYVRDIVNTQNIEVALFALGTYPKKSTKKAKGQKGVDLNFAGVLFKEGDYLYADEDGIVLSDKKLL